ncbi:hypothetical protein HR060_05040 [Catenovulum sp. SM1970]|uniref:hypothetical protein n=1 Tax=Marinifaba aquimaris TaxID=2741323 RepID=UPI0015730B27|nr:hypothetical protein [Marinifaba aquimaris]NTS76227.1 hypothetical protein [Marinifaba aquimaris]
MISLKMRDESSSGQIYQEFELSFEHIQISVKDLIVERVYQEVIAFNQKATNRKSLLVAPSAEEKMLNQALSSKAKVNPEKQIEIALNAFKNNAYFILVDDLQVDNLEQVIDIKKDTDICFVKLVQLIGG